MIEILAGAFCALFVFFMVLGPSECADLICWLGKERRKLGRWYLKTFPDTTPSQQIAADKDADRALWLLLKNEDPIWLADMGIEGPSHINGFPAKPYEGQLAIKNGQAYAFSEGLWKEKVADTPEELIRMHNTGKYDYPGVIFVTGMLQAGSITVGELQAGSVVSTNRSGDIVYLDPAPPPLHQSN